MASNRNKGRDLSRLGMVGTPEAGAAWQSLVSAANVPGERLEGARELPINTIEPAPDQPRKRFDEERLQSLADSLREDGVIQPIVVRPMPGVAGRFFIVAGERRWRAAGLAGLSRIPAVITEEADDAHIARMMLRENIEREDLDIEDLGLYLQTLVQSGATQREIAALTHFSLGKVNGLLQLVKRPELVEKIRAGLLTQEQALEIISSNKRPAAKANPVAQETEPQAAVSPYRPLARLATWAATFKPQRVPQHERAALRAHLDETINRLERLRDEIEDENQGPTNKSRGRRSG